MSVRDYLIRRVFFTMVTVIAVSMVSFLIITLPGKDLLHIQLEELEKGAATGDPLQKERLRQLIQEFYLDRPIYERYGHWAWDLLHGNFGRSLAQHAYGYPVDVNALLRERVPMTAMLTILSLLVSYLISMPLGVFCAIRQYSVGDFVITAIAFIGMAVPAFLLALVLLWGTYLLTGRAEVGFFSLDYRLEPWSLARVGDLLRHLPIPLLIVGISGTGGTIRTMRAILLDELRKPYVTTARAKGVPEARLFIKYPLRIASNPIVSGVGGILPAMVSGGTIVEIVLELPTMGPLLFSALTIQDMYLAASGILIITTLTVVGVALSDMLLAVVDPRIRFER